MTYCPNIQYQMSKFLYSKKNIYRYMNKDLLTNVNKGLTVHVYKFVLALFPHSSINLMFKVFRNGSQT